LEHRRAQEPLDSRDARASFSGDLSEVALPDLVQTLEMGRRTGALRVTDRAGRTATVWLREGRPVDCELGSALGEAAFHRLLRWTEGEFAVEFEPVTRPARITASTQALVMEGLRRVDAWRSAVAQLPDLASVTEIDFRLLSERLAEIPDDMNALLRLVDGRRTLLQVIEEAGVDDLAAVAMVGRLFAEQIVRIAPPRGAPAPPPSTPEPERVTWFAGPSDPGPAPAPRPEPAPTPPTTATPPRSPAPAPEPPLPQDEPRPPRIVRFPPRERGPVPTPRPGETASVPSPLPGAPKTQHPVPPPTAARRGAPAPAPAPTAGAGGGRTLLVLLLALVTLAGGTAAWRRLRTGATGEYEAWLSEARRLREAGRLPEAIAGYRRAVAARDTSAAEAELGRALSEASQPAAAIDALQRAVELDGGNAEAYIALGEACVGEQRLVDARRAFERYLALEPQGGRADEVRAALERIK
jgi:uncharacterized protein DUF4388/tetratricopeptide repeat protein